MYQYTQMGVVENVSVGPVIVGRRSVRNGAKKKTNGSQNVVVRGKDTEHETDVISAQTRGQSEHHSTNRNTE